VARAAVGEDRSDGLGAGIGGSTVGRFDGKVVVVTGGGGGQGRSHALALAREGAQVSLWDVNADAVGEAAAGVKDAGGDALGLTVDLTDTAQVASATHQTVETFGGIDHLVAQQGKMPRAQEVWTVPESDWDRTIAINLTGTFLTCKHVIPEIIARGRGGAIVLTSSTAGLFGYPYLVSYGVAKHGVLGLGKGLANELAPYGIRVNMLCPGAVDTPMVDDFAATNQLSREDIWKQFDGMDLLGAGLMKAEESTTPAVLYLLSDDAKWVTGHVMVVDAGATAKPSMGTGG